MQLNTNEHTIKIFRKHWLVMFFELLLFVVLAIIPAIALLVAWSQVSSALIPPMGLVLLILFITWVLMMWLGFFIVFTDYFLDVWILTNQRLIDVDQKGLFSREVATLRIEKVEDVTVDITGIFPSMFNYGNIHVQSAGAEKEFTIRYARNPQQVKHLILREQQQQSDEVQRVTVV